MNIWGNWSHEQYLAGHVIHMTNLFYGLDSMKIKKIAYDCAEHEIEVLKIHHNFMKKSKFEGPDWLEGFLRSYTKISIKNKYKRTSNIQYGWEKNFNSRKPRKSFDKNRHCYLCNECCWYLYLCPTHANIRDNVILLF